MLRYLAVIFLVILITACHSEGQVSQRILREEVHLERQQKAWNACITAGGIPIRAWHSDMLAKCQFPPNKCDKD